MPTSHSSGRAGLRRSGFFVELALENVVQSSALDAAKCREVYRDISQFAEAPIDGVEEDVPFTRRLKCANMCEYSLFYSSI